MYNIIGGRAWLATLMLAPRSTSSRADSRCPRWAAAMRLVEPSCDPLRRRPQAPSNRRPVRARVRTLAGAVLRCIAMVQQGKRAGRAVTQQPQRVQQAQQPQQAQRNHRGVGQGCADGTAPRSSNSTMETHWRVCTILQ